MTSEMNNDDDSLEPDSPEDNQFLSDEWTSDAGALIEVSIDPSSWHSPLIADLKKRGPVMLDHIASRLSLDPQIVSLLLCNDVDMRSMNFLHRGFDKSAIRGLRHLDRSMLTSIKAPASDVHSSLKN